MPSGSLKSEVNSIPASIAEEMKAGLRPSTMGGLNGK